MSVSWLRLHHDFRRDPKLRNFSRVERSLLIDLLLIASESNERGTILLDSEDVAAELDLDQDEYTDFIDKLIRKKIISSEDDGALMFINWDIRQTDTSKAPKPSDAPEQTARRQRERRARLREQKELESRLAVTPSHADCHEPSHAPSRVTVTPREEKRREIEREDNNRASAPPLLSSSLAQSASNASPSEHIVEPDDMVTNMTTESVLGHFLDDLAVMNPPSRDECEKYWQDRRGRGEVGVEWWKWYEKRGWRISEKGWKHAAELDMTDWCKRHDKYIVESPVRTKPQEPVPKKPVKPVDDGLRIAKYISESDAVPPPADFLKLRDKIGRSIPV